MRLEPDSFDSCVTDPPYHLTSISKRWSGDGPPPVEGVYRRSTTGFMGRTWDGGDVAFQPETWAAVLRVMKPGAHLVAFGGTRSGHRLACAIEDAGFEIRDCLAWVFGSGFPKSHNLNGDWNGWGTALKPAWEMIYLARKPLSEPTVAANVMRWGTGAINIDGCRVGEGAKKWEQPRGGIWNTDTSATAALVDNPKGRWPANLVHDGSDEVVNGFPESTVSGTFERNTASEDAFKNKYGGSKWRPETEFGFGDSGSAARFFYTAKADADDRIGSRHPTVKPLDLLQWLCRLITPPRGLILDPFAGTGTTAEAALREGFSCSLIEREAEYLADIERRMALAFEGTVGRSVAMAKLAPELEPLPLFAGLIDDIPPRKKINRLVYGKFALDD